MNTVVGEGVYWFCPKLEIEAQGGFSSHYDLSQEPLLQSRHVHYDSPCLELLKKRFYIISLKH